jgi:hypothetical protein
MVLVGEFSNLSTFSILLLKLSHPERLSSSIDIQQTLKRECQTKTTVQLKECSPKATQSTSSLPSIADEMKQELKEHSCKNNACPQCSVTRQTDATGLRKCDLGLPSYLFSPRQSRQ